MSAGELGKGWSKNKPYVEGGGGADEVFRYLVGQVSPLKGLRYMLTHQLLDQEMLMLAAVNVLTLCS